MQRKTGKGEPRNAGNNVSIRRRKSLGRQYSMTVSIVNPHYE
jgi:hypothetical protein